MYKLPVEIHLQITVQADLFPEFLYATDTLYILWILITDPDRYRCSPIALARNGPIHIIFEPGDKTPCSVTFEMPVHLSFRLHHIHFHEDGTENQLIMSVGHQRNSLPTV